MYEFEIRLKNSEFQTKENEDLRNELFEYKRKDILAKEVRKL